MAAPSYDTSEWPLLWVTMHKDGLTDPEVDAHVRFLEQKLQAGQRFALLIDARQSRPLSPRGRQAIGQLLRRSFQRDPRVIAGIGVVLSSAIERGVLTAITWAAGRTYPQRAFATPMEAADWLLAQLATKATVAPPR